MIKKAYTTLILLFAISQTFAQGILIPSGYGAWGNTVFAAGGGTTYSSGAVRGYDVASAVGYGFGNPAKGVGVEISANILSMRYIDLIPLNAKIHRYFGYGISLSAGLESFTQLAVDYSFEENLTGVYLSMSSDLRYVTSGFGSRFAFVLGAGNGRFSKNGGSYVFGGMQFRFTRWMNLHADWSGQYPSAGLSFSGKIKGIKVNFLLAGMDLMQEDPKDITFGASLGFSYRFKARKRRRGSLMNNDESQKVEIQKAEIAQLKELNKRKDRQYLDLLARLERVEKKAGSETYIEVAAPDSLSQEVVDLSKDEIVHFSNGTISDEKLDIGYYVILYTFQGRNNTQKAITRFKYMGLEPKVAYNKKDKIFYIYLRRLNDEGTAIGKRNDFRGRGFDKAWVLFYKQ